MSNYNPNCGVKYSDKIKEAIKSFFLSDCDDPENVPEEDIQEEMNKNDTRWLLNAADNVQRVINMSEKQKPGCNEIFRLLNPFLFIKIFSASLKFTEMQLGIDTNQTNEDILKFVEPYVYYSVTSFIGFFQAYICVSFDKKFLDEYCDRIYCDFEKDYTDWDKLKSQYFNYGDMPSSDLPIVDIFKLYFNYISGFNIHNLMNEDDHTMPVSFDMDLKNLFGNPEEE